MIRSTLPALALLVFSMVPPGLADSVSDRMMAAQARRLFPELLTIDKAAHSRATIAMMDVRRRRIEACNDVSACVIAAASWSDSEREQLLSEIRTAASSGQEMAGSERRLAIAREIRGINAILSEYGSGARPARYPLIDGPDSEQSYLLFASKVADAVAIARAGRGDPVTALDPSIGLALSLLDANDRNDASAYEPIDGGMNGAASARAPTIDWSRYRYTAIIVPGIGPDELSTALSPKSKLNVRMAAELFATGVAPFIIVSGGNVHPRASRFNEAVEMRRALIERFAVPADSIVIEPYARHTTTNLRNVSRRLMGLGAPLDRDAIVVTNLEQSRYIDSPEFTKRNELELGYQPGTIGRRLTPTEILFRPSARSARVDPSDPLDP